MFDLFAFWASVSGLSLPALLVFVSIAAIMIIALLKEASRGRFNPADKINKTMDNKLFIFLFIIGCFELVILTMAALFWKLHPVTAVTNLATLIAPIGGWITAVGLVYGLTFGTARKVFDKVYSLEDRIQKQEDSEKPWHKYQKDT